MKKIAIIGGGASGMMAAIAAARHGGSVTIYEHKDRPGKKILATGNGKCNLTNLSLTKDDYRGNHPSFVVPVLEAFSVEDTLALFQELGLCYKEKNGYVYPVSNQASTVLDLLRMELKLLKVQIVTECGDLKIQSLHKKDIDNHADNHHKGQRNKVNGSMYSMYKDEEGFSVKSSLGEKQYDRLIIATGSKASPVTGSDGSGYQYAKQFGHSIVKVLPALVQLKGEEAFFKPVAGVRMDVDLSLYIENDLTAKEQGELQLTNYGLSGIPIFQLSRFAVKALDQKKKVHILCDFLPGITKETLYRDILIRREKKGLNLEEGLNGILNKKLTMLMIKQIGLKPNADIASLTDKQVKAMCRFIKECYIPVLGFQSFENAQVCQGGVSTEELTDKLESRFRKGLYFVGEIIDIDGICGGYNLQWAWSSGYVAGKAASEE